MCEKCAVAIGWQAWLCLPIIIVIVKQKGNTMKKLMKRIWVAIRYHQTIINPMRYAFGKKPRRIK